MIEGVTSTGFEYSYDERILNDYDLVKTITRARKAEDRIDKLESTMNIAEILLGEKEMDKLIKHIRSRNDGYAPIDQVDKLIVEIMQASAKGKN